MRTQHTVHLPDGFTEAVESATSPAAPTLERREPTGAPPPVDTNPAHAPRVIGHPGGPVRAQHANYTFRRT